MSNNLPSYDPMLELKLGASQKLIDREQGIIRGGRCHPENGTSGWYLYMGERPPHCDVDFFKPIHGEHLIERYPVLLEFLILPPGYAFIYDAENGYTDIYEDPQLLAVTEEAPKQKF